jgi:hypothetical protein
VDADKCEGLVFQVCHERPLVGPLGPSGESDEAPEVEQHNLATVVAELEGLAVLVLAFDVGASLPILKCRISNNSALAVLPLRP